MASGCLSGTRRLPSARSRSHAPTVWAIRAIGNRLTNRVELTGMQGMVFPDGFLWGAATAPHQIEGNNVNSDFWANEGRVPGMERSGDACDSYHRYREDMRLLAEAGLNAYRFGIEWARIEPVPGMVSRAELAHYRRMIDTAFELGLTPLVTLHHFTSPLWFAQEGGWLGERAVDRFRTYVETVAPILEGVEWIVTMNEPNML